MNKFLSVPCVTCGAPRNRKCRTSTGNTAHWPHTYRQRRYWDDLKSGKVS